MMVELQNIKTGDMEFIENSDFPQNGIFLLSKEMCDKYKKALSVKIKENNENKIP